MSGIHGDYKEPVKYYSQSFNHINHNLTTEGNLSLVPDIMPSFIRNGAPSAINPKTRQVGDIYNRRLEAIRQQLSQFGSISPAQQASYMDATKAVALQNFAETTEAQMEAKVLKNWERKIENYIQVA